MKTKNVYIFTDNAKKDFDFMDGDIKERQIKSTNIFTDVSFESAYKQDVAQGLGVWDKVRMINADGKEKIYT